MKIIQAIEKREDVSPSEGKSKYGDGLFFSSDIRFSIRRFFAPVIGLFLVGSPTAVLRRVRSIIIDAFKAHIWRTRTHVCKEIFKRIPPTIANRNPTCSVFVVAGMVLIVTSAFHRAPSTVFRRCLAVTSLSMRPLDLTSDFSLITTARNGFAGPELVTGYPFEFSTIAFARPNGSSTNRFTPLMRPDYNQSAEFLSFQINKAF
jgi:hypothetical protein